MASDKRKDQPKTSEISKTPAKDELSPDALDKVVGGLKKNTGGAKPGIIGDPCDGGEIA